MTDRGYGGLYVPVGMAKRSQMDALNPLGVFEKAKRRDEGECPDCVAERELKQRAVLEPQSVTSVNEKMVATISDAVASLESPAEANLTTGKPMASNVVAAAEPVVSSITHETRPLPATKISGAVTMSRPADVMSPAEKIVPELISYIDTMATRWNLDIGQRHRKSQSLLQSEDAAPLLTPWTMAQEEMEQDYWQLRRDADLNDSIRVSRERLRSIFSGAPLAHGQTDTVRQTAELPSAILRSNDLSPPPISPPAVGSPISATPIDRSALDGTPSVYYTAPTSLHPTPPITTKTQKRVRVLDAWPPNPAPKAGQVLSPRSPVNAKANAQFARQNMRLDRQQAVMDAAEMERALRRNVRAKGGLAGPSGWKKAT